VSLAVVGPHIVPAGEGLGAAGMFAGIGPLSCVLPLVPLEEF